MRLFGTSDTQDNSLSLFRQPVVNQVKSPQQLELNSSIGSHTQRNKEYDSSVRAQQEASSSSYRTPIVNHRDPSSEIQIVVLGHKQGQYSKTSQSREIEGQTQKNVLFPLHTSTKSTVLSKRSLPEEGEAIFKAKLSLVNDNVANHLKNFKLILREKAVKHRKLKPIEHVQIKKVSQEEAPFSP